MPQNAIVAPNLSNDRRIASVSLVDWLSALPEGDRIVSRAIVILDRMIRERGAVILPQHDFTLLRDVVDANRGNRASLSPMHDTRFCRLVLNNSFWLAGFDASGRVVTTNSGKLFDWRKTNLEAEARSLRLVYDDPAQAPAGDLCHIDSPIARRISGFVFHSGTVWRHPQHRGELSNGIRISQLTGRLTRMVGLALWNADFYFSLTRQTLVDRGVLSTLGYSRFEPGLKLKLLAGEELDVCLNWMDRSELQEDARTIVEDGHLRQLD
ncbi:MAG: hypothetical protein HYR63_04500 [Proteobacteria bacterium]|nr:hypothetical protein [Pseudomonadota bacterium]MBI3499629.1 hypothetical protein [Pseudomonadota bacterium]